VKGTPNKVTVDIREAAFANLTPRPATRAGPEGNFAQFAEDETALNVSYRPNRIVGLNGSQPGW
jgi:hypothetical protein